MAKEENGQTPEETKLDATEETTNSTENISINDDDQVYTSVAMKKVRSESAKYRIRAKNAEARLNELESKFEGIDLEAYQNALKQAEEQKMKDNESRGEFEKVKLQMVDEHKKALAEKDATVSELKALNESLNSQYDEDILNYEITRAAQQAEAFNPKLVRLICAESARVLVDEKTGKRKIRLYGSDGSEKVDADGKPITVEKFVQALKTDREYAYLFKGGLTGANSSTMSPGTSGKLDKEQVKTMSHKQIREARDKGLI